MEYDFEYFFGFVDYGVLLRRFRPTRQHWKWYKLRHTITSLDGTRYRKSVPDENFAQFMATTFFIPTINPACLGCDHFTNPEGHCKGDYKDSFYYPHDCPCFTSEIENMKAQEYEDHLERQMDEFLDECNEGYEPNGDDD